MIKAVAAAVGREKFMFAKIRYGSSAQIVFEPATSAQISMSTVLSITCGG